MRFVGTIGSKLKPAQAILLQMNNDFKEIIFTFFAQSIRGRVNSLLDELLPKRPRDLGIISSKREHPLPIPGRGVTLRIAAHT